MLGRQLGDLVAGAEVVLGLAIRLPEQRLGLVDPAQVDEPVPQLGHGPKPIGLLDARPRGEEVIRGTIVLNTPGIVPQGVIGLADGRSDFRLGLGPVAERGGDLVRGPAQHVDQSHRAVGRAVLGAAPSSSLSIRKWLIASARFAWACASRRCLSAS